MKTMDITMLGSGCWEGTPAPFCKCKICSLALNDPLSKENRSRPELFVKSNEGQFLIEISPDIRMQSTRFELPIISDFIVSHWHFDHLFGLYELHAWIELVLKSKINIYGSIAVGEMIERQFGFIPVNFKKIEAFVPFELKGVKITPIPVHHMKRIDEGLEAENLNNTFGYILESNNSKVAYLADYYEVPERSVELIQGSDKVIVDGTYLFEEHYPNKPYQQATLEENDPDHIHGKCIIDFASKLQAKEVIYHSITHLPEKEHDELQALLPANHYVSYDGMKVI